MTGTVASFDSGTNTLVITGRNGKPASYTLANNVTITKMVAGQLGDLHQGETVRVEYAHGSTTTAALIEVIGA